MIVLYILFISNIQCDMVSFPFSYSEIIQPRLEISFPLENATLKGNINTYLPYTILQESYNPGFHLPEINRTTIKLLSNYKCSLHNYNINIDNITINNFSFYIGPFTYLYFCDEGISLTYKYNDESFSLVHTLYNQKMIDHLYCIIINILFIMCK